MSTTVKLDKATLASGFADALKAAIAAEKPTATADANALAQLAATLEPFVAQELVEIVTSANTAIQQGYLAGLAGIIASKSAELALDAEYAQPAIITTVLTGFMNSLATAVKNPTVQLLLRSAVAGAIAAV